MQLKLSLPIAVLVGCMILAAGTAAAQSRESAVATSGSTQHSTYLSQRASTLLAEIQREAVGLRKNADTLGTLAWNSKYSWQSHAEYLNRVKDHINAVGERILELQGIRDSVLPWQLQAITEVTTHAVQVAGSTQAAIVHLNENQNRLFVSDYRDHLTTIADRTGDMKQAVDKFLEYEKGQQEVQQLREELEPTGY